MNDLQVKKMNLLVLSKQRLSILLAGILFITSLLVRLHNFPSSIGWIHDAGRDFLAGSLINERGINLSLGHWNSGAGISYPSHYYKILSVLTSFFHSVENISLFLLIIYSLTTVVFFLSCNQLFSLRTSFLVSLLFALSPRGIFISSLLLSAHVSIIPFIFTLWLLLKYLKTKNFIWLFSSLILLLFTSSIFYGSLFFLPLILLVAISSHKNSLNKKVKLLLFSLITIIFGYVVIFHSVLSSQVGGRLFLSYYLKQIDFSHILQMLPIITHELKTYSPNFYLFFIFSLIALSIKHMVQKKYHTQIGLLLFVFVALVFLLSINSQPLPHYIIQFYPFLFLLIGFNLQALELQKRMRTYVFYFLILFYLTGSYNPHLYQQAKTSYQEHKLMVQHLDEKYGADSYLASEPGSNFYWNSRAFWYFQNDKSYFYISDENSQIDIEPQGKIIYICEDLTADSAYCENFSSKKKLEKIDQIYIGQKFFFIYKSSGS